MSNAKKPQLNQNQTTALHLYDLAHSVPLNPLNKQYSLLFDDFIAEKSINLPTGNANISHNFCANCGTVLIAGLTLSIRIVFAKKKRTKKTNKDTTSDVGKQKDGSFGVAQSNNNDSNGKKHIGRKLQYRCLRCNNKEYEDSLIQQNDKKRDSTPLPSAIRMSDSKSNSLSRSGTPEPFKAEWSPLTNSNEVSKDIKIDGRNSNNGNNKVSSNLKSKERSKKRKQNSLSNMLQQKKQQKLDEAKGKNSLNLMEFMNG
ncbi:SNM1-like protein [Scheffersomyces xylosifermentans]|uniref:SNM1-like protein n=1 Tax=Scheffersomyces xylosifermentans TaxID=1304137 RepID=UPI00315D9F61